MGGDDGEGVRIRERERGYVRATWYGVMRDRRLEEVKIERT